MRRVILIAGVAALLFLALMALSGDGGEKPSLQDQRNYRPDGWARLIARLGAPFAPRIELGSRTFALAPGQTLPFSIGPAEDSSRIGRFALAAGSPAASVVKVTLDRPPPGGNGSSQEVCLAAAPAQLPGCAEKAVSEGSVVVGMDGGKLTLQALGSLPATVEQR